MEPNEIIDINHATREELTQLPGVGVVLAERIIVHRQQVGPFGSVAGLAAVAGISSRLLDQLTPRLNASTSAAPREQKPLAVQVQLNGAGAGESYAGHKFTATFAERKTVQQGEQSSEIWITSQVSNDVPASGQFVLELPNRREIRGELELRVIAPDGEILLRQLLPVGQLREQLPLEVQPKQYAAVQHTDDPAFGRPTRLRGRVIDLNGQQQIGNRQVVIWGAQKLDPTERDFRAMFVVQTDATGYFSGPYPLGNYSAAYGSVAADERAVSVPIHLNADSTFPDSVILAIDAPPVVHDHDADDCDCHTKTPEVPRNPDMADLARGDGTYSSDPGQGRCVDFTKPDRTLEEFAYSYVVRTTEPEIKGLTLEEPEKIDVRQLVGLLPQTVVAQAMVVDSAPTVHSAAIDASSAQPMFATQQIDAKILKTLAADPDGFSLTRVAMASQLTAHADLLRLVGRYVRQNPRRGTLNCETPVDWDDEPTIYQACTIAHGHVLRFKQEWVADGYSMGNLLYSLPLAPGQKKLMAIVDWERREVSARSEAIDASEDLDAAVTRDRDINDIVNGAVSESVRGGSKSSSGGFGGGLGIGAILPPVGGLLGIGGGTASASSSAWQNSSRNTSLSALNQLRDRTVQSASSVRSQRTSVVQTVTQGERVTATTETVANYNHCHAMTIQYFEVLRHMLVRQRLTDVQECLFVPLLMTRFSRAKALRWRNTLRGAVRARRLRQGFDALERIDANYVGSDFPLGTYADQSIEYLDGDLNLRFQLARPRDAADDFDAGAWSWLGGLLPFISPSEFYRQFLKDQQFKDRIFLEQLGTQIAEHFVQHLHIVAVKNDNTEVDLKIDATLLSPFFNNQHLHVSLRMADVMPSLARKDIKFIKINGRSKFGPFLFDLLPRNSKVIVESGNMRYRTKYSSGFLFRDARILNDLTGADDVRIYTPLNSQEQRNPREEDKELARQLMDHLNEHTEHYHHAIWWRMSDDRRYMLLDGFEAPNSGGRSVASVVENELIGIVGNSLVMPVARGYHLDPTYRQNLEEPIDLLEHYQPNTPIEPMRIAIPTRGVYAEAVMGACNSCEIKEEQRFWRWEESPIPDSPPAILPVSTESRRAEPPTLTAKDFPQPIVAMQSAPAAPDPTGLSAAFQLLGTSGLFKDITGLEGTQRNAAAALQGALDTAQFFGGKAADLALQAKMARDIDKTMRTIQGARQNGSITEQQAQQLSEGAIRSMMGGGPNPTPTPISTRDVEQLVSSAGQHDASLSVNRPTGERVAVDARRDASVPDSTARPVIILPPVTNAPENRAFGAGAADLSAVIDIEATVRNAPSGASYRWSRPDPTTLSVDTPNDLRTRVRGVRPGRTELDFSVHDTGGAQHASVRLQLSVPQFVRVTEDAAAFDAVLGLVHLSALKNQVIATARQVCQHLLRTSNVRTVWQFAGFTETLPAHVTAANVTVATFRGDPPTPGLLGQTNFVGGAVGAAVFNETIDIFPGAYDDPSGSNTDVDVETQALILQLESQAVSDPALEAFAISVYGRLLGETLAHEIVHSLLGLLIPSGHNNPAVANDLMNQGTVRTFRQRTGFEDTAHTSPIDPANFIDHGIAAIGGLQGTNQGLMDARFPVPPALA